jgi:hypothetical protein
LAPLRRMGYVVLVNAAKYGRGGLCADLAQAQPPTATQTFD